AKSDDGGETHAIARCAVRVRHRRDRGDLASRSGPLVVRRWSVTARRPRRWREWRNRAESGENLVAGHHVLPRERTQVADGHELDESHMPRMVDRKARQIFELIVIDATHHDHVELDRLETSILRGTCRAHGIEPEV